jgi:hypothetical protein
VAEKKEEEVAGRNEVKQVHGKAEKKVAGNKS